MTSRPILVVHPGSEMYGSDRVLLDSVIGLAQGGSRVVAVLPEAGPLARALSDAGAEVRIAPTLVLRKSLMKPSGFIELIRSAWAGSFMAWKILRRERPAAVYVSTITMPLYPLIARVLRTPVVVHVHEAEASASRAIKLALYAPVLAADRVLINSTFSKDVMASAYPTLGGRAIVLPNAVPGPEAPTAPRPALTGGIRLLFVGRLSPRKGPDLVVTAVEILTRAGHDVTLDIAGSVFSGYEWYAESLSDQVARADLGDRVRFHGFQDTIWPLLDDTDALVVPSRLDEPFGNTAVEGVLALRPVIVSDTSGLREATSDIPTALKVEADSAQAIADAVIEVVASWATLTERAEDARQIAESRHSEHTYRSALRGYVMDVASDA